MSDLVKCNVYVEYIDPCQGSLLPSSHVAQGDVHPGRIGPPGLSKLRYSITSPALIPPNNAVIVTYIRSRLDAVSARSGPPGIAA